MSLTKVDSFYDKKQLLSVNPLINELECIIHQIQSILLQSVQADQTDQFSVLHPHQQDSNNNVISMEGDQSPKHSVIQNEGVCYEISLVKHRSMPNPMKLIFLNANA